MQSLFPAENIGHPTNVKWMHECIMRTNRRML
jgi:hypothetical protein